MRNQPRPCIRTANGENSCVGRILRARAVPIDAAYRSADHLGSAPRESPYMDRIARSQRPSLHIKPTGNTTHLKPAGCDAVFTLSFSVPVLGVPRTVFACCAPLAPRSQARFAFCFLLRPCVFLRRNQSPPLPRQQRRPQHRSSRPRPARRRPIPRF